MKSFCQYHYGMNKDCSLCNGSVTIERLKQVVDNPNKDGRSLAVEDPLLRYLAAATLFAKGNGDPKEYIELIGQSIKVNPDIEKVFEASECLIDLVKQFRAGLLQLAKQDFGASNQDKILDYVSKLKMKID